MRKLAAIDLGSNAVRMAFAELDKNGRLTIYKKFRIPLRLGSEAFEKGEFSEFTLKYASKAFEGFSHLIQSEKCDEVLAVATSASRDVKNSTEFIKRVKELSGIYIHVISGNKEAELIRKAVEWKVDLKEKNTLLMDIGGGSLELTVEAKGLPLGSKSFQLGTVRLLEKMKKGPDDFESLDKIIKENSSEMTQFLDKNLIGLDSVRLIGTGGNFRRMLKLKRKIFDSKNADFITPEELEEIYLKLCQMPYLKRMKKFDLRPDRADVIIPAIRLTLQVIKGRDIKKIHCPDVGLVHGLVLSMGNGKIKEMRDHSST